MDEEETDDDEDIDDDVDKDEGGPSIGGGADNAAGAENEAVATPEQGEVAILPSTSLGARSSVSGSSSENEGSPSLLSTEAGKGSVGERKITATLTTECVIEEVLSLSQEVLSTDRIITTECVIEEVSSLSEEVIIKDEIPTMEYVIEEVSSYSQEVISTNTIAITEKAEAAAATVEEGPVDFNHYQSSEVMEVRVKANLFVSLLLTVLVLL